MKSEGLLLIFALARTQNAQIHALRCGGSFEKLYEELRVRRECEAAGTGQIFLLWGTLMRDERHSARCDVLVATSRDRRRQSGLVDLAEEEALVGRLQRSAACQ